MRGATLLLLVALAGCVVTPGAEYERAVVAAGDAAAPAPMLASFGLDATLAGAYARQRGVVRRFGGAPVGFKAGLTSPGAQARFGAAGPVAGVLLNEPLAVPRVVTGDFATLMVELELAFRLRGEVSGPVTESEVTQLIECVAPALEFPDLGYRDMANLTVADIVASNVAARMFWVGDGCSSLDGIDALQVRLSRDGATVTEGTAADAMGGQRRALAWLINHTLDAGYPLRKGAWLITGALGAMVPGEPGTYTADFGHLGSAEVVIVGSGG